MAILLSSTHSRTKYVRFPSGYTVPEHAAKLFQQTDKMIIDKSGKLIAPPRLHFYDSAAYPSQLSPSPTPVPTYLSHLPASSQAPPDAYSVAPSEAPAFVTVAVTEAPNSISYPEYKSMMTSRPPEGRNSIAPGELTTVAESGQGAQKPHYTKEDTSKYAERLHTKQGHLTESEKNALLGHTYTTLGGSQFYQSLFGGKNGFSPLSYFLGASGRGGQQSPLFVPVPVVVPPPPPPPPGPKCYTNPSGFLCCNATLENTIESAFMAVVQNEGISLCNVQRMAGAVQEAAEKKFGTPFESIVGHKDFVAKVNFAGDLNCKIEINGKFLLAYATPIKESEVNIIDANSFFSGDADELFEGNATESGKPTYIVYGPI